MLVLTSPAMNLCRSILLTPHFLAMTTPTCPASSFSSSDCTTPIEKNTNKAHVKPLSLQHRSGLRGIITTFPLILQLLLPVGLAGSRHVAVEGDSISGHIPRVVR